ncbi:toll/interleukin-1 receptor domain-containing protein [Methylotenera sp. L2L1]|uniref:toll/interleukin-1 receptor domain-containing protein n=1 Tax=Methylotenera sp. L2L1 TaxID=1502770 RepID=UPI000561AABA|nr:toll/interleukin-1 receptor domain-containing protein [Methylotenera sp. L2L1]
MSTIFLSHSHADKPFARRLAADLRKAGHAVWIDEAEINIGDSLIEKIREGLDQVDFVAAIITAASVTSKWVTRELDIASNREIEENRIVVLPLLVEYVELPGFLKGKFYGDFTDMSHYDEVFELLLRKLGSTAASLSPPIDELTQLRAQLSAAKAAVTEHEAALHVHETLALRGKSEKLIDTIAAANKKFPFHAPINFTHAFEVGNTPVTLDYLLWAIAKSERKGAHPLEALLTLDNKWPEVHAMLSAYESILSVP